VLRTALKHISRLGRATQGIRVMNLKRDDVVASVAVITSKDKTATRDGQDNSDTLALEEAASEISGNGQGG
jgi:DNA gyrase/topoisomerase IV subunit A